MMGSGGRETGSPADKLGVAEAQAALAAVLLAQGSHAEAEDCWRAALSARESLLGVQHPLSLQTHQGAPIATSPWRSDVQVIL